MDYKDNQLNWRNITTLTLLVILTTVIIVALLPRKSGTHYIYDPGKPWKYGPVIAKYNFDIIRPKDSIQHDIDQVIARSKPYYILDNKVEMKAIDDFSKAFNDSTAGELLVFKEHIIQRLRFIYPKGIMSPEDYIKYASDSTKEIQFEEGTNVKSVGIKRILTPKTAYELLFFDEELKEKKSQFNRLNINDYIKPNLTYDDIKTQEELKDTIDQKVAKVRGSVVEGEKIVDTGELVTDEIHRKLQSLEKKEEDNRKADKDELRNKIIGQSISVLMLIILFTCYLLIFRKNYFDNMRNILMLYALILVFPILVSMMIRSSYHAIYVLPFAMAPMLTQVFLDSRTAFITHTIIILISSIAVNYAYEFILIEMAGGLAAIFALNDMSKRAHLFKAALMVVVCSVVMYYATQLIQNDSLVLKDRAYLQFIFNGILLLLAYPLMWTIEKAFGFTSVVTLFELSDSSRGLLRKLSEIAPGTFQHSTTVGNLAYDIANRIGANGLLVRTGALYHDIGKMTNPVFFTENQASVNPHNKLSEKESAQIITSHVTEGQKLAEKYNLPNVIKNFILTHHGHGTAKYFYIKYLNEHPNEEVDVNAFSYQGLNPFTREQAILMMADSVEAASRSLKEYNDENIRNLVNKIIDGQVNEGFFTECPITFLDIATAKQVLIERLKNIYHTRIQYPELKKEAAAQPTEGNTESQNKGRGKRNRMKFKK